MDLKLYEISWLFGGGNKFNPPAGTYEYLFPAGAPALVE